MKRIFVYLEVALELTGLDCLVRGLSTGAPSFLHNFLSNRSPLMLVGMLIRPADQERLSLVGECTTQIMSNGPHLGVHKCIS